MKMLLLTALMVLMAFTDATNGERLADVSICDHYAAATFGNANATSEYTLIKLLVNTLVIGNFTPTLTGESVPGLLATGDVDGTTVNLLQFFDGSGFTSNEDGVPSKVNFLDGGGAAPMKLLLPANDWESCVSEQCQLFSHLYQLFGSLLGCSTYNTKGFPAYAGPPNLYAVHKYMKLTNADLTYFVRQLRLTASAYGVEPADVSAVDAAIHSLVGDKCSKPAPLVPGYPANTQSICNVDSCPMASPSYCGDYTAAADGASETTSFSLAAEFGNLPEVAKV